MIILLAQNLWIATRIFNPLAMTIKTRILVWIATRIFNPLAMTEKSRFFKSGF